MAASLIPSTFFLKYPVIKKRLNWWFLVHCLISYISRLWPIVENLPSVWEMMEIQFSQLSVLRHDKKFYPSSLLSANGLWNIIHLNCGERYEDIIDQRSYIFFQALISRLLKLCIKLRWSTKSLYLSLHFKYKIFDVIICIRHHWSTRILRTNNLTSSQLAR